MNGFDHDQDQPPLQKRAQHREFKPNVTKMSIKYCVVLHTLIFSVVGYKLRMHIQIDNRCIYSFNQLFIIFYLFITYACNCYLIISLLGSVQSATVGKLQQPVFLMTSRLPIPLLLAQQRAECRPTRQPLAKVNTDNVNTRHYALWLWLGQHVTSKGTNEKRVPVFPVFLYCMHTYTKYTVIKQIMSSSTVYAVFVICITAKYFRRYQDDIVTGNRSIHIKFCGVIFCPSKMIWVLHESTICTYIENPVFIEKRAYNETWVHGTNERSIWIQFLVFMQ